MGVLWRVTLPQVWPILASATMLAFALSFDEFVVTVFTIGNESTLPMYVYGRLRRTIDPLINSISTLLVVTTLALSAIAFALSLVKRSRSVHGLLGIEP